MFIASKSPIKQGDRVRSTKEFRTMAGTFTAGHVFTVVGETERGWMLQDDDGNGLNDAGWSHFVKVGDA